MKRPTGVGLAPRPMAWRDICEHSELQGRWVALDDCAYDANGHATEGAVVDYDANLSDLCARLQADQRSQCAVVFCPPRHAA